MKSRNESTGQDAGSAGPSLDTPGVAAGTLTGEAAQDSSDPFRSLFAASLDAVLLTAPDGRILAANAAACRLFGYSEPELIAAGRSLVVDSSDPALAAALQERARTGKFHGELTFVRKDGTRFPGEISSAVFTDRQGRQFTSMVIRDITERKWAEAALKESEQKFRTIFHSASDGMFVADSETRRIVICNPACSTMLGYTQAELRKLDVRDLHPPEQVPYILDQLAELARGGTGARQDTRFRRKDGTVLFTDLSPAPMTLAGRKAVLVVIRDTTERKRAEEALRESEERFREVINNQGEGLGIVDVEERFTFANPAGERVFGVPPGQLVGRTLQEFTTPDQYAWVLEQTRRRRAGERGRYEMEIVRPDGQTRWLLVTAVPRLDAAGRYIGAFGLFLDITEAKRAEAAMRQSQQQLRALSARVERLREEERTRISREIHDQLGQLVTALKMDLRAFQRRLPALGEGPARAELADKLTGAIRLSDELIERMHDMAAELRPGLLDNLGLVAAMQEEARRFQARTDIACAVAVAEPFPPLDAPTSTALYRILQEILANVARHAQATSVQIRLAEAQGAFLLEVHDNGKGISDAALIDSKSLGLLGMRERAAALGGSVEISGKPGLGTTVWVRMNGSGGAGEQRSRGAEGWG